MISKEALGMIINVNYWKVKDFMNLRKVWECKNVDF